jgi:hypothetical protein
MSSRDTDKDKIEKKAEGDRQVHITEEHLFDLIERGSQKTAEECFKHFEKLHNDEMQFQHKVHLEDKEFERQKDHEEREFKRKNLRIERWWRVFAIVLAAAGFYLFWIGSIETEKATSQRAANEHTIDLIRADMAEKKKVLDKASIAIGNMRQINYNILLKCKYGHPYSMEEQESMRWAADQKIIDAFALAPYVFNDEVYDKQKELIQFSVSVKDVCAYKGDYDSKILQLKRDIFNLTNKLVKEDQKKIERLK